MTPLRPTLVACLLASGVFAATTGVVTRGFTGWTFEDLRRDDARAGRLVAPPLSLRTSTGAALAPWAAGGDASTVWVVDFVYTRCPTVCQALGSGFARMQATLAPGGPRLLSVSIDPARDDPAALAGWARAHGAQAPAWIVAAPRTADESRRFLRALGVIAVPDGLDGFVHNGAIHVIDGRGTVHGIWDDDQGRAALLAATRLAQGRP